jgi:hypothetical protein
MTVTDSVLVLINCVSADFVLIGSPWKVAKTLIFDMLLLLVRNQAQETPSEAS